jgi:hypothetical protein
MIYELMMKTCNIIFIESEHDYLYFLEAKEKKKNLILDEIEITNNTAKNLGEILVDVYSIETIRKIKLQEDKK